MSWWFVIAAVAVLLYLRSTYLKRYYASLYWLWDDGGDGEHKPRVRLDLEPEALNFPREFLWGVASAAHQIEGGTTNNQWAVFETKTDAKGRPCTKHRAGAACDHWNRVKEDTALIKNMGMNASRFSVEWSRIEPKAGEWNEAALKHYDDEINLLISSGITPMITLHHFTHPIWFEELKAFEKIENLQHFVTFAEKVFDRYSDRVKFWCTFNEPEVFVTGGYFSGTFPPGLKDQPQLAGTVLSHILESHVRIYEALKKRPNGTAAQIGIVKDIFQMDPRNPLNPADVIIARMNDSLFNECIFEFFRTGQFVFSAPGMANVRHTNLKATTSNDFFGLNYYSHYLVAAQLNPKQPFVLSHNTRDGAPMTDMPYPIYAEGLYRAIQRCATLKVPIYITENGLADAADDRRALFIRRYLYAVSRAIADGYDVRGYFWWSAMDNFEWAEGYTMRFGLYAVDFNLKDTAQPPKLPHKLRDGSKALLKIMAAHYKKHGIDRTVPVLTAAAKAAEYDAKSE